MQKHLLKPSVPSPTILITGVADTVVLQFLIDDPGITAKEISEKWALFQERFKDILIP